MTEQLNNTESTIITQEEMDRLQSIIENPPQPNEALKSAMSKSLKYSISKFNSAKEKK